MGEQITFALAKGRLAEQALALLEKAGVDTAACGKMGRKLVVCDPTDSYRFMFVKPGDVPTYVDYGVADIGVVGKDTLLEENRPLYEMLDLGFGQCRLCIAGFARPEKRILSSNARVATKYPNIARRIYEGRGEGIEIIRLSGSIELAPLVGLADVILDIVESGGTLKANGLEVLEEICPVSARMVVNRVSLKTKGEAIGRVIENVRAQLRLAKEGGAI